MPIFRTNPFDDIIARATDENNVSEDWSLILEICDKTVNYEEGPKFCLQAINKRLHSSVPRVAMQALMLLDACVKNCDKRFLLEVSSRAFVAEITKLLSKMHISTSNELKQLLKKWAERDFKDDPELGLIPSLYYKLKSEHVEFPADTEEQKPSCSINTDPNAVNSQEEEEDIIKALELSLKETKRSDTFFKEDTTDFSATSSFPDAEPMKVRTLYDFEAVEDNELSIKAGEIVLVIDKSNSSWWKGSNHRGEGYFPSNFITENLDILPEVTEGTKEVKTSEKETETACANEPVEINEEKIEKTLIWLNETDPTLDEPDPEDMLSLERECSAMTPLIEEKLQQIDRKFTLLNSINEDLMKAIEMFYSLDSFASNMFSRYNLQKGTNSSPQMQQQNSLPVDSHVGDSQKHQQHISLPVENRGEDSQQLHTTSAPKNYTSVSHQNVTQLVVDNSAVNSQPTHSQGSYIPVMKQVIVHHPVEQSSSQATSAQTVEPTVWYQPVFTTMPPNWGGEMHQQQVPYLNSQMPNSNFILGSTVPSQVVSGGMASIPSQVVSRGMASVPSQVVSGGMAPVPSYVVSGGIAANIKEPLIYGMPLQYKDQASVSNVSTSFQTPFVPVQQPQVIYQQHISPVNPLTDNTHPSYTSDQEVVHPSTTVMSSPETCSSVTGTTGNFGRYYHPSLEQSADMVMQRNATADIHAVQPCDNMNPVLTIDIPSFSAQDDKTAANNVLSHADAVTTVNN